MERVLILTKDFSAGEGTSEYIRSLSLFLAKSGIETHIVCFGNHQPENLGEKIHMHRVPFMIHGDNIFNWSMLMNNELKRRAREIFEKEGFDIVHANDWLTSSSAVSLSKFTERPLVATIHSTEKERGFGIAHSGLISDMEWWLTFESKIVLANNTRTYASLKHDFALPDEKIRLINPFREGWQEEILKIYESLEPQKVRA